MPPLIVLALGAVGAVLLVRVLMREARRINGELGPRGDSEPDRAIPLERDPATGVYRPKRQ
jgi:hypothetical protein